MSDYGMIVRNSNHDVLIDGKLPNFAVWGEGHFPPPSPLDTWYYVPISPVYGYPPIILVHPLADFPVGGWAFANETVYERGDYVPPYRYVRPSPFIDAIPCDFVLARSANEMSFNKTYGMEIYSSDGNLIFTTDMRNIRLRDVINVPGTNLSPGGSLDINHKYISKPYYIIDGCEAYYQTSSTRWATYFRNLSPSSCRLSFPVVWDSSGTMSAKDFRRDNYQIMVCEVGK